MKYERNRKIKEIWDDKYCSETSTMKMKIKAKKKKKKANYV